MAANFNYLLIVRLFNNKSYLEGHFDRYQFRTFRFIPCFLDTSHACVHHRLCSQDIIC